MLDQLLSQWPALSMFLALLILPLMSGAMVIALAWRTIPGFVAQSQKRQFPMALAILVAFLTMWLGCTAIFPLLPDQRCLVDPLQTPNVEVTGAARPYRVASVWTAGLGGHLLLYFFGLNFLKSLCNCIDTSV